MKTWTLTVKNKIAETPNTGSSYMTRISGLNDWTVEVDAYWDLNQVPTDPLKDSILVGKTGTVTLNIGSTAKTYSGSCIVEQAVTKNDVEDKIGFTFTLQGNGALTAPVT